MAGEMKLILEELTNKIISAAIEVHKALGSGFLESIYENALCKELTLRGIRFAKQHEINVLYKGEIVGTHRLDLIVEEQVIVELKALRSFEDIHYVQLHSYLKATNLKVGLLLNFGTPTLQIKRIVN